MRKDNGLTWKLACLCGVLVAGALQTSTSAQGNRSAVTQARVVATDSQAGVDLAPSFNLAVTAASLRTNATMLAADQSGAFPRSSPLRDRIAVQEEEPGASRGADQEEAPGLRKTDAQGERAVARENREDPGERDPEPREPRHLEIEID